MGTGLYAYFHHAELGCSGSGCNQQRDYMNLVGWMIINWRESFAEGDFIQIQNYSGYVSNIGPLYFKIYETVNALFYCYPTDYQEIEQLFWQQLIDANLNGKVKLFG